MASCARPVRSPPAQAARLSSTLHRLPILPERLYFPILHRSARIHFRPETARLAAPTPAAISLPKTSTFRPAGVSINKDEEQNAVNTDRQYAPDCASTTEQRSQPMPCAPDARTRTQISPARETRSYAAPSPVEVHNPHAVRSPSSFLEPTRAVNVLRE